MTTNTPDTDADLFWAAVRDAGNITESPQVRALRAYTHAEMLAGRIDHETQDHIGRLIDTLAARERTQVGDVIGPYATRIPWDVLEVTTRSGGTWRRVFGDDRHVTHGQVCDWISDGNVWATGDSLRRIPLQVTKVAEPPTQGPSQADDPVVVEYAQRLSGGSMSVRPEGPDMEEAYPLEKWIKNNHRVGGRIYRRSVIVVEDWAQIEAPESTR